MTLSLLKVTLLVLLVRFLVLLLAFLKTCLVLLVVFLGFLVVSLVVSAGSFPYDPGFTSDYDSDDYDEGFDLYESLDKDLLYFSYAVPDAEEIQKPTSTSSSGPSASS